MEKTSTSQSKINQAFKKAIVLTAFLVAFGSKHCFADYTVTSGASVNASTITAQSGVLTINGTLYVDQGTVNLLNFTSIVINAPNGQIYWNGNYDLKFSGGVTFVINTGAPGLQPTGGNAATRLYIGSTLIAVSNDNSNNAAFSFADFNAAGGLPLFNISSSPASPATICYGNSFTATITPLNNTINYDCKWTINNSGSITPANVSNFNSAQTATITPTNSATAKTYTITCTLYRSGDVDAITAKTVTVTVNPAPAAPTFVTATPNSICAGSSTNIKGTSSGNTIEWYTVSSGGTSIGSSASAATFSVSPASSTTYFAAAKVAATGCVSTTRTSVAVTVSPASVGGTVSGNANVCTGSNTTILSLTGQTGSVVRWESSTDNFATAPATIVNTNSSITINNISTTTYYRAVVASGACTSANSSAAALTVSNPGTWLGVNTDWNSSLNWCNGAIPSSSTNVTIPAGLSNYPIITGTALANNVTVLAGEASITVTGTLKVAGSISSAGAIDAAAGTIELNGSAAQLISGNYFTSNTIANFNVSNTLAGASAANPSVAIATTLNITGSVGFGNLNNAVLKTNDNLVIKSSASSTGSIADLTNNNTNSGNLISGKVTVERYIPSKRAWRLLTAPITAASNVKISDSWQEGAARVTVASALPNASTNPNPGYGTHITYGYPAAAGYDQGVNGNTSIKYLNATGWNGVPTATNSGATSNSGIITDQPGYLLFVRGDRSIQLSQATAAVPVQTVLRVKGNLNIGQQTITLQQGMISGSSQFRLVGNPFASTINFHKIMQNPTNTGAGFTDAYYVWDASIGGVYGLGGWVVLSYNSSLGHYEKNIPGSTVDSLGNIESGAAFLIDYTGSGTSMVIRESDKGQAVTSSMFRPVTPALASSLRTSIFLKNSNTVNDLMDGALISFDNSFDDSCTNADIKKINNLNENIAVERGNSFLSIERRRQLNEYDSIRFKLSGLRKRNYLLKFEPQNVVLPNTAVAFISDNYMQEKKLVDLNRPFDYNFSVDANTASYGSNRFKIIVQPFTQFIDASAAPNKADVVINWSVLNEYNNNYFVIERSADDVNFEAIGSVTTKGDNDNNVNYQWKDEAPKPGIYYYRVKAESKTGGLMYTTASRVQLINAAPGMFVYPNPVENNIIQLRLNEQPAGSYSAELLCNDGKTIHTQKFIYNGSNSTQQIAVPQPLSDGHYLLRISGAGKQATIIKVLVQKR